MSDKKWMRLIDILGGRFFFAVTVTYMIVVVAVGLTLDLKFNLEHAQLFGAIAILIVSQIPWHVKCRINKLRSKRQR